jgi:hypothetical protein
MMVVYPFILAIFESLGQVGMKAVSCMLKLQGEGKDQMGTNTFWVCLFLLCVDGYLIIIWLAKVYGKFETTGDTPLYSMHSLYTMHSIYTVHSLYTMHSLCTPYTLCTLLHYALTMHYDRLLPH